MVMQAIGLHNEDMCLNIIAHQPTVVWLDMQF